MLMPGPAPPKTLLGIPRAHAPDPALTQPAALGTQTTQPLLVGGCRQAGLTAVSAPASAAERAAFPSLSPPRPRQEISPGLFSDAGPGQQQAEEVRLAGDGGSAGP